MLTTSGATTSLWMDTATVPTFAPLTTDVRTQVCVVGAGVAGLTTAYLLTRAGKAVTIIDDGPIGGGETSRTTAHLSTAIDDRYETILQLYGEEGARLVAQSHCAAIDRIEAIAAAEDIDCEFERVDGYLVLAPGQQRDVLTRELQAAHRAGLTDVELVTNTPLHVTSAGTPLALRFPRQGQLHLLRYVAGVANAIVRDGGQIYSGTKAVRIEDGEPGIVETADGHIIQADHIVVTTNSPVNDWMVIHTKQAPYRTYVIAAKIPRGSVPHALLWDTLDPYHFVRVADPDPRAPHEFLLVGGEDHKTGQADDMLDRFVHIESWMRQYFPMAGEITHRWSGQIMEPIDALAFLGKNPGNDEHIYIITGGSGHGITHATIGGMIITDLICGKDNPWAALYDPSRITVRAALEFSRETLNVAEQYAAWITPGDTANIENIPLGSGAVVRRGVHKVAVYRAPDGTVTECSAVCPHLYCIVHWNTGEKTWDCPCHGSRFDPYGRVMNGPAISDLDPLP